MKKIFILTILSALSLASCNQSVIETPDADPAQMGTLALTVSNVTDYVTIVTKADAAVDYSDTDNYDVIIDGPTKLQMKYSELAGKVIELGSGNYSITVVSPSTLDAAFEQPIYRAYQKFVINAGEVTPLDLVCTPYNCKVTIELSENFKKELATYEVVVNNGLGSLTWTKNESKDDFGVGLAGYFTPRGLEVKVKGHRSIDNKEATAVHYVQNPKAGEHHIIKLDAKVTGQIGGITIQVLTEFNEVSNDVEIGGLDEEYVDRPDFDGNEDFGGEDVSTAPSILWAANPFFDPYTISPSSEVSMVINAPLGFETFIVEVSENFKPAIKVFTQSDVDYIDLINHGTIWSTVGLPVGDAIKGQTSITFELTPFISTLCNAAAGMTVDFILKAGDPNGDFALIDDDYPVVTMIVPE